MRSPVRPQRRLSVIVGAVAVVTSLILGLSGVSSFGSLLGISPAGAATAKAGTIECPAGSLNVSNPVPTTSSSNLAIAPPTESGLSIPQSGDAKNLRRALNNSLKFNMVSWFNKCYGHQTGPVKPNGRTELPVRTQATVAYAAAVALATGAYNPAVVGLTKPQATKETVRLIVGLAMAHLVNSGSSSAGWGHDWQSSYWAFMTGTAGWLLYKNLTVPERQAVARMVAYEADYQVYKVQTVGVRYYADRSGNIETPGNTGAEEDAWDSTAPSLAALMMPNDPRAAGWRHLEAQFEVAAFSRPADIGNQTMINGQTVDSWLGGTNIFDDGTLVNHNHLSPEYMVTVSLGLNDMLTAGLAGKPGLQADLWNDGLVYSSLVQKNFSSPPYSKPGGPIYRKSGDLIYYPQGNDWGTVQMTPYLALDALATNLGFGTPYHSSTWFELHLARQLQLQSRFTDGRTFAGTSGEKGSENRYLGREQVATGQLAQAWLSYYLAAHHLLVSSNAAV